MKKIKRILAGTLCLSLAASLCVSAVEILPGTAEEAQETGETEEGKEPENIEVSDFTSGITKFSLDLLNQMMDETENVLFSPVSAAAVLAMTESGASGETLSEMEQVLGNGVPAEEFQQELASILESSPEDDAPVMISSQTIVVNNEENRKLNESFVEKNTDLFDSEIMERPFSEETVKEINEWVDEKTDGMIPELITSLDPLSKMCLLNALLFKGEWANQFLVNQLEEDQDFHCADGTVSKVTMLTETMTTGTKGYYLPLAGGEGFVKYYKGGEYAFFAVLPPVDMSLKEYVSGLTAESFLNAYLAYDTEKDVALSLPEFSLESDMSLTDCMQEMGIKRAFSALAEFDGMLESGEDLYISDLIQKAVFNLDQNGTYAAAATAGIMEVMAIPIEKETVEIVLDRPFLFGIVESTSGIPVFLGAVNSL